MSSNKECPVCGEGTLHEQEGEDILIYKGQEVHVPDYYSVCDSCGSEIADEKQSRKNKRAAIVAKKRVDGIPLGEEIRALRERYNITQKDAARLFGGGPTAFSKYENDDVVPSAAMTKLLRLVLKHDEVLLWLAEDELITINYAGSVTGTQVVSSIERRKDSCWPCNAYKKRQRSPQSQNYSTWMKFETSGVSANEPIGEFDERSASIG